ncbi:MAG TPA: hypothetical protein VIS27_09615 [Yeosuana sp.]
MKPLLILLILCTLVSCGTASLNERIFKCMERVSELGGDVRDSYDVCKEMLTHKQPGDRTRSNK